MFSRQRKRRGGLASVEGLGGPAALPSALGEAGTKQHLKPVRCDGHTVQRALCRGYRWSPEGQGVQTGGALVVSVSLLSHPHARGNQMSLEMS